MVTIVAKIVNVGFEQTTFSTCMGLASTLAIGTRAMVVGPCNLFFHMGHP